MSLVAALVLPAAVACSSSGLPKASSSASAAGNSSIAGSPSGSKAAISSATSHPVPQRSVPVPGGGNISQTVAASTQPANRAVPLSAPATFTPKVVARVVSITDTTAKARVSGEVGGPALKVAVSIHNATPHAVNLQNSVVDLQGSSHASAISTSSAPASPFHGRLAAGHTAHATYVFTLPRSLRRPITIRVSYAATEPVVVFVGNAD